MKPDVHVSILFSSWAIAIIPSFLLDRGCLKDNRADMVSWKNILFMLPFKWNYNIVVGGTSNDSKNIEGCRKLTRLLTMI